METLEASRVESLVTRLNSAMYAVELRLMVTGDPPPVGVSVSPVMVVVKA